MTSTAQQIAEIEAALHFQTQLRAKDTGYSTIVTVEFEPLYALLADYRRLEGECERLQYEGGLDSTRRAEAAEAKCEGYHKHLDACEQIAGKALGYPWFKDDQKNFPGSTEADGVFIGEHVGDTIVEELANRYTALTAKMEGLAHALRQILDTDYDEYGQRGPSGLIARAALTTYSTAQAGPARSQGGEIRPGENSMNGDLSVYKDTP